MAKEVRLIITGDPRDAEKALKDLQRTGSNVAHALERDFDQLGTKSGLVFDGKRKAAQDAYARIKSSSLASASDIAAAERGLASTLKGIDEQQYGQRLTMAEKFRANIGQVAAAAGVAYGAFRIGKDAVEQAKEFQTALTDLGKVGVKDIGAVRAEIMAMPEELGSAQEIVKGYYQTISAGVTEPKRALELLTTAAKTAKAAHVDQETVIKGLTKVMAGYGGAVKTAAEAADLLFGIEKLGQTSVAELVPIIGDLASISHQVGVNQFEMGAALAQVTQTAGSTAQAATQYRAILIGLLKPQKTMQEALEKMGYSSGTAAIQALGLSGTLQGLANYADAGGISMGKLFESSEALTGLGPLLNSQFEGYNKNLAELQTNAGAADQAFLAWQGTLEATEALFRNTVGKVMIELGTELAPSVNEALRGTAGWIAENKDGIIQFVEGIGAVIRGVVSAAETAVGVIKSLANAAAQLSLYTEPGAAGKYEPYTPGNLLNTLFGGGAAGSSSGSVYSNEIDPSTGGYRYSDTGFATGTRYVPRTGIYQLHRGEEVLTRGEVSGGRQQAAGQTIQISGGLSITVGGGTAAPQTSRQAAREIYAELQRLGLRFA